MKGKKRGLPCPSCFPLSPIRMLPFHPLRLLSPRTSGIFSVPDLVLCGPGCPNYMALWDKLEKKWAPWGGCSPWESAWLGKQARLQQPTPFNWIFFFFLHSAQPGQSYMAVLTVGLLIFLHILAMLNPDGQSSSSLETPLSCFPLVLCSLPCCKGKSLQRL